jgi:hypothetical protein
MTLAAGVWRTRWATPDASARLTVLLLALAGVLFLGGGCASRQREPAQIDDDTSIERPAVPLSEETSLTDRIGEVGVVILVVGITLGLILIPLLLL